MIEPGSLQHIFKEDLFLIEEKQSKDQHASSATDMQNQEKHLEEENDQEDTDSPKHAENPAELPSSSPQDSAPQAENIEKDSKIDQMVIATEVLSSQDKELLRKIMAAINYKDSDYKVAVGSSSDIPKHKKAIIFTKNPRMPLYEISHYKGTELLTSKSLEELQYSTDDKRLLWNSLKKWFGKD